MAVKEFPAGTQLIQSGQNLSALHVIAKGSVRATYPGGEFYLSKGDVIGVCEIFLVRISSPIRRKRRLPLLPTLVLRRSCLLSCVPMQIWPISLLLLFLNSSMKSLTSMS